jgi:hypothetical protein
VHATVGQIVKSRQDLGRRLRVEPDEILVVSFDEDGASRRGLVLGNPCGKVAWPP